MQSIRNNFSLNIILYIFCTIASTALSLSASTANQADPKVRPSIIWDSVSHPTFKNHYIYRITLADTTVKRPVVLFCHGIGATSPIVYQALLEHIARRGYSVFYSPFPSAQAMALPELAYSIMWQGFTVAAHQWGKSIDSTRIGVVGHSFGGGAVPAIAYKSLTGLQWGQESCFLYSMAPWFCHGISSQELASFPRHCIAAIQVFEDDLINDHRMAIDIYKNIGIPASQKTFSLIHSSLATSIPLIADHNAPCGTNQTGVNKIDSLTIYQQFDDLADSSSIGTERLHNTSTLDTVIGAQSYYELYILGNRAFKVPVQQAPKPIRASSAYINFWSHSQNPRTILAKKSGRASQFLLYTPVTILNYCLAIDQRLR